ncbi:hypothetical protein BDY19DRAFT_297810 [Irpex rosettiformis]|uniref:Uncharacterized protein n=1 Tax=Irpex rosettiformis TaxID=378272 RepID=A0ACB8UIF4_9APHY|nr:hypothetical protein BDY19DRAFT_297810 [Irpex rosettiformis]
MAGGHGGPVRPDPAIERWVNMREDVYKTFRWTPKTTMTGIVGLIVFPGLIYWAASSTDLKYKWAGKTKNESLKA